MTLELTAEALRIIDKVKKLLALANDTRGNEHQAAAAAAKAQELLQAYNLDMAVVGETAKGRQGKRSDEHLKGGLYKWQRDLWHRVADLNFCMYWSIKGLRKGSTYEHRILGRIENVIGAQVMAEYLQSTVERLAQDAARERGLNVFCREMIAYREGMAARLAERLWNLRQERIEADALKQREQQAAQRHPGAAPSNGMGIVLATVIQTEQDLNIDHLYGQEPGTTARQRAEREARCRMAEEATAKFLLEHPEEAAARAAEEAKAQRQWEARERRNANRRTGSYRERKLTPEEARRSTPEFRQGYHKGSEIGLDPQVKKGQDPASRKQIG